MHSLPTSNCFCYWVESFNSLTAEPSSCQNNSASLFPLQKLTCPGLTPLSSHSPETYTLLGSLHSPQARETALWVLWWLMTCPRCNPACLLTETDSSPLININYQIKKKVLNFSRFKKTKNKTLSDIQGVFFSLTEQIEVCSTETTMWMLKVEAFLTFDR